MKNVIVIVLLVLGGLLAYNYFTSGELTLIPSGPSTPEMEEIKRMERSFETAQKEFNQALRSAGMAGLDTTGDAEAAMKEVKRIERSLDKLVRRLGNDDERKMADRLKLRIKQFRHKAGE